MNTSAKCTEQVKNTTIIYYLAVFDITAPYLHLPQPTTPIFYIYHIIDFEMFEVNLEPERALQVLHKSR